MITGATGLVGSWLARDLLTRGAQVVALIRDADPQSELYRSGTYGRCSVVNGELEEFRTIERAIVEHGVDTVFHLAAQAIVGVSHQSPLQTFESNIRGTYNLLEACRIHGAIVKRVVIASSDKAYGQHDDLPYTEDMALQGCHPYEVSKSCADLIAQSYFATYRLPVTIARCGNVFGGGDLNWSRIVPGTIRSLFQEERPIIRSDGSFIRDYIYVRDAAHAYAALAEASDDSAIWGEPFNFSPEQPFTVLEIVDSIRRLMEREDLLPDVQDTATGEIRDQYLDSSKARRLLGWRPQYSLEDGLSETIDWYRHYFAAEFEHRTTTVKALVGERV